MQDFLNTFDFNQNNFLIVFSLILLIVFIFEKIYIFLLFIIIKKNFFKDLRIKKFR